MLKKLGRTLLNILYPKNCHICSQILVDRINAFDSHVCLDCVSAMRKTPVLACRFCGKKLSPGERRSLLSCPECAKVPPPYQRLICCYIYEGRTRELISAFKYGQRPYLAPTIVRLMLKAIPAHLFDAIDYLVPVPLYGARLREREFNQAELIAKELSCHLKKPVILGLERKKNTQPQHSLNKKNRIFNLKGSFRLAHASRIKDKNILVIDDIATSTATVQETSRILKEGGANTISVLTFAKG